MRLFHGRPLLPLATFAGAAAWLLLCQLPVLSPESNGRIALGVLVVAAYTFVIAFELWRERRKSLRSRTAAIVVPSLHAAIFLMPLVMKAVLPDSASGGWLTLFAFETIIYAVGAAFVVLVMVKDQQVHVYRNAANTDHLTGLLNRRAFMDSAHTLSKHQGERGEPLTLMMFDLDHFKSINDRFGHAVGDDVLRVFAKVASGNMRTNDIIGRLGGEEFAAIVPGSMDVARSIAERLRNGFETSGARVGEHAIGATVSIGAATSNEPVSDIDALIIRADSALYSAKHAGRNRLHAAEDEPPRGERERSIAAACKTQSGTRGWWPLRKSAARRAKPVGSTAG
ncbi:MAG: GGDEF domain-containing protein [Rhizobiales bacterium]|nr:GGDEF domain-containing protein [Hyphomicrobiales bacterium]